MVIASIDWLPLTGNLVEATEELINDYNGEWKQAGGAGQHPRWLRDMRSHGTEQVESFSFDLTIELTHRQWRGIVRSSAAVGACMPSGRVARLDERVAAMLEERFPTQPIAVPHGVWAGTGRLRSI